MKGRKSHAILEKGLQILVNLDHRGAVGADATLGDGCGVLTQIPHGFFARNAPSSASPCPGPGITRSASSSCRATPRRAPRSRRSSKRRSPTEGLDLLGWRDMPVDNSGLGERVKAVEPAQRQVFIGRARGDRRRGRRSSAGCSSCARSSPTASTPSATPRIAEYYPVSMSCRTIVYKGMVLVRQLRALLPGPARPALRDRAGAGPSALRHQHLPVLAARPPLPHGRPQRRDQHPARQRQLDGGAPGERRLRIVRRRHLQAVADLLRRPVGHRLLRQRARVPGARRLLARPRDDDADPGGLGRQSADGRGAARLLRVPRRADGAVGRPGGDGLHRRPPDRRDARPQRPEAGALFRHRRRAVRARLRNGRAADAGGEDRRQVAPAAGQDAARRSRRGPHRLRRRDQAAGCRAPTPTGEWLETTQIVLEELNPVEPRASRTDVSLLDRQQAFGYTQEDLAVPDVADGGDRPGSGRLDGRRHADLGALRQVEAALHLFQAELRPGHQPADRPDPRRAGDEPGVVHRPAAQPVRPRRPRAPQAARGAPADPHQRGPREDPLHRPFRGFVRHQDARHHL